MHPRAPHGPHRTAHLAPPQVVPFGKAQSRRVMDSILCVWLALGLGAALIGITADDPGAWAALSAPWQAPLPAVLALVCLTLVWVGLLVCAVWFVPGALVRCSVTVGASGLEITEHAKLWRSGRTTRVPWEAVRLAVFREAAFRAGKVAFNRPVLELFTDRPLEHLPDFATCREAGADESRDAHGRPVAPYLLRIGATSVAREAEVRHVADLAAHHRRDLFHPAPGTAIGSAKMWRPQGRMLFVLTVFGAVLIGMAAILVFTSAV